MQETAFEVLVVDDEPTLREQIGQLIAAWGYRVRIAGDVTSALEALDQMPPDIILTDLVLPDQPGYALLEQAHIRLPHMPVLVMTAYASLESAIEALGPPACAATISSPAAVCPAATGRYSSCMRQRCAGGSMTPSPQLLSAMRNRPPAGESCALARTMGSSPAFSTSRSRVAVVSSPRTRLLG